MQDTVGGSGTAGGAPSYATYAWAGRCGVLGYHLLLQRGSALSVLHRVIRHGDDPQARNIQSQLYNAAGIEFCFLCFNPEERLDGWAVARAALCTATLGYF